MKSTFTSALLLLFACFCFAPEPVAAASAAPTTTTTTFSWGGSSSVRRTKKVRSHKMHRSSAARAMAKRNRRSPW